MREKKQTPEQQKQAAHALSLYFEILRKIDNKTPSAQINTEKAVKATSPSTPSPINIFGDRFIKGESSNTLSRDEATPRSSSQPPDSSDIGQASVPPPLAGKRFNVILLFNLNYALTTDEPRKRPKVLRGEHR